MAKYMLRGLKPWGHSGIGSWRRHQVYGSGSLRETVCGQTFTGPEWTDDSPAVQGAVLDCKSCRRLAATWAERA